MLPDWRREAPKGSKTAVEVAAADAPRIARRLADFTETLHEADRNKKRSAATRPVHGVEGIANCFFAQASDKALCAGVGLHLASFQVQTLVGPLGPREKRYFLEPDEAAACPNAIVVDGEEGRRRSCIEDEATGDRRYEIPQRRLASNCQPFFVTDEGPVGPPFIYYLLAHCRVRG